MGQKGILLIGFFFGINSGDFLAYLFVGSGGGEALSGAAVGRWAQHGAEYAVLGRPEVAARSGFVFDNGPDLFLCFVHYFGQEAEQEGVVPLRLLLLHGQVGGQGGLEGEGKGRVKANGFF